MKKQFDVYKPEETFDVDMDYSKYEGSLARLFLESTTINKPEPRIINLKQKYEKHRRNYIFSSTNLLDNLDKLHKIKQNENS